MAKHASWLLHVASQHAPGVVNAPSCDCFSSTTTESEEVWKFTEGHATGKLQNVIHLIPTLGSQPFGCTADAYVIVKAEIGTPESWCWVDTGYTNVQEKQKKGKEVVVVMVTVVVEEEKDNIRNNHHHHGNYM